MFVEAEAAYQISHFLCLKHLWNKERLHSSMNPPQMSNKVIGTPFVNVNGRPDLLLLKIVERTEQLVRSK